MFLPGLIEP